MTVFTLRWSFLLFLLCALFKPLYAAESLPAFSVPNLFSPNHTLTQRNLTDCASLLVVWASWCPYCRREHPLLMKIKSDYHLPIYGITYQDDPASARRYLESKGNPYKIVGSDPDGQVADLLGVRGVPELFLINRQGLILYKHQGVLNQEDWDNNVAPLLKEACAGQP